VRRRFVLAAAAALLTAGLVVGVMLAAGSAGPRTRWKIHDVGMLRGLEMAPVAVNDRGEIVGYGYGAGVAARAFLYRGGQLVALGSCGG